MKRKLTQSDTNDTFSDSMSPEAELENSDTSDTGGGNKVLPLNRSKKRRKVTQVTQEDGKTREYYFTWNNYPANHKELLLAMNPVKLCFQPEIGHEEKTPHLGGLMKFQNARSKNSIRKACPGIYLEALINEQGAIKYCHKLDTKDGDTFIMGYTPPKKEKVLKDPIIVERPWQTTIMQLCLTEPDDRTINWYWEPNGKIGKSALIKHFIIRHPEISATAVGGSANDIYYAVSELVKQKKDPEVIFIDIPRDKGNSVSYEALESLKNGLFFNSKYESGCCIFNAPHIIIFSNFPPDTNRLSTDRWNIVKIDQEVDTQPGLAP